MEHRKKVCFSLRILVNPPNFNGWKSYFNCGKFLVVILNSGISLYRVKFKTFLLQGKIPKTYAAGGEIWNLLGLGEKIKKNSNRIKKLIFLLRDEIFF